MSRFSGAQGRGAIKKLRERRAWDAYERQVKYWVRKPGAADPVEMLPPSLKHLAPPLPARSFEVSRG